MRIPNAEQAFVDIGKLRNYCLSLQHPRGKNKARVFAASLGLTANDSEALRDAILLAILTAEAKMGEKDIFGQRYFVDFQIAGPITNANVRTTWIIRTGEGFPRLTSCYIL